MKYLVITDKERTKRVFVPNRLNFNNNDDKNLVREYIQNQILGFHQAEWFVFLNFDSFDFVDTEKCEKGLFSIPG